MHCLVFILGVVGICLSVWAVGAEAQQPQQQQPVVPQAAAGADSGLIRLVSPQDSAELIAKRPEISLMVAEPLENVLVMFDGTDVTQLTKRRGNTLTFKPIANLAPGSHTLMVSARSAGQDVQKEFRFTIRHYASFQEASSNNQMTVISDTFLGKAGDAPDAPYQKVEGNLKSENRIAKDNWQASLNTNVRYLEQTDMPQAPLERGVYVPNWLFSSSFTKDAVSLRTNMGDVQITETPYTVSGLSRKGTILEAAYGNYYSRAFTANTQQRLGLDGGIGTTGSEDERIMGISAGAKFFNQKMDIRGIYVTGGDTATSAPTATPTQQTPFGTTTTPGRKRGDVLSFAVATDFFSNKLKAEAEAAFSNFNPDTSAEGVGSARDGAYKATIGGVLGKYSYGAGYELIGKNFGTVGNPGAERDKQKMTFTNGLNLGKHAVNLGLLRANDNVRNDDLFARTVDYNTALNYAYTGIKNLPMSLAYMNDRQTGTGGLTPRLNKNTNTVAGTANYTHNRWNWGFTTAYSSIDDLTPTNADNTTTTFSITPAYNGETFNASSSLALNRTFMTAPRVWTDTYTVVLNLRKYFLNRLLVFDTANTFTKGKSDQALTDIKTLNLTSNLSYSLQRYFKNGIDPVIGVRSSYLKNIDKITPDNDKEEVRVFLVLTLGIPFAF